MQSLICRVEKIFDCVISQLVRLHPVVLMCLLMTVPPIAILVGVCVSTTAVMLPISLLFGWI